MEPEILLIVLTAMILGYSLLRQLLNLGSKSARSHKRNGRAQRMTPREADDLRQRAEELMRRLNTVEEIIASEPSARRS